MEVHWSVLAFHKAPIFRYVMQSVVPMEKLKDFIAFARARCHPQLTEAAATELIDNYLQLRRAGSSRKVNSRFQL